MLTTKMFKRVLGAVLLWGANAALAQAPATTPPTTLVTGLRTPQDLLLTPRGNFLVSEPNTAINSGRVSFVSRSGQRRSLFEGLPSGTEVTGGGSGPSAMVLRERTLYLTIGGGDVERTTAVPRVSAHNPEGISSPIFSSVLAIHFSADIDTITGTFTLTPAMQALMADGLEVTVNDGAGATARLSVLADFPNSMPDANVVYRFSNPWGMTLAPDGVTLIVADASMNALVRIDTATGRWQRVVKFPPIPNSTPVGPPMIDAVPTTVRYFGNDILVSTLTGFPFVEGAARVSLVNGSTGVISPFINNLTTVTDVVILPKPGARPVFFTLEFSLAFTATPRGPGRLLRFDSPTPTLMSATLPVPVSMVIDESTNSLFVLSLAGMILEFKI
jgi:hypothetical protein